MHAKIWITGVALMATTTTALAGSCEATSATTHTPLVELYTSEGCSSCPPADRWLSTLKGRQDVVALAFHVDYWDYIGWKDRFADPHNSRRQRDWARQTGAGTIYTPQILVDGRDSRAWRGGDPLAQANTGRQPEARIHLRADTSATGAQVSASASVQAGRNVRFVVARFENGHESRVEAGENNGRTLHHDYVVRDWSVRELPTGGELKAQWQFLPGERAGGYAAFVQDVRTGAVLQSVALDDCS